MQAVLELIAKHKAGTPCGMVSVCSAHPLVIKAALLQAKEAGAPFALVEATCNQVNQEGGYTGMTPLAFRDFVADLATESGLAWDRVVLGGDHLGPNPWTRLPAAEAMDRAERMVGDYVRAGFRKIHADCSMSCADDPVPLAEAEIAARAARLIAAAEAAWREAGGEAPVYIIGTEVPVPGGAAEELPELEVTAPEAALATIRAHREVFAAQGLAAAWPRIVGLVVQPGVEFDHHKVIDYAPGRAVALSRAIAGVDGMVYEAHSTDYQTAGSLAALVRDHFAILKVGPGVTFALREALWALDAIEREWIPSAQASRFREIVMERMRDNPHNWEKYYHSAGHGLAIDLQYSLSDRIRYYWPDAAIVEAQGVMFRNLETDRPPLALISQYLPDAYQAIRAKGMAATPENLVVEHIRAVLADYYEATFPKVELTYA